MKGIANAGRHIKCPFDRDIRTGYMSGDDIVIIKIDRV
jgi:hypothetical protein